MSSSTSSEAARHRFAVLTACTTGALLFFGALVTSTGSGLAVPDWPLSFGQFFPPMVGGVAFEHGHRLVASVVGCLTIVLAAWMWRREPRAWVRRLAGAALAVVIVQGLLGGLTVLLRLPPVVSVAHGCLAQAFFCMTVILAVCTGSRWRAVPVLRDDPGTPRVAHLALITTAAVYGQLVLGAIVRHTHSGLAIPDFPLAFGRLVPPVFPSPVLIHYLHRLGAVLVAALVAWTAVRIWLHHRAETALVRPMITMLGLLVVQILLGASIVWTRRAILPTTAHVVVGAGVLAAGVVLSVRAARVLRAGAAVPGIELARGRALA
jgi:cytochrome c oxidase assembly protein subunit 15